MDLSLSLPAEDAETSLYSFPVGDAQESIRKRGAYAMVDLSAGDRVHEFMSKRPRLKTPSGLEFCAKNSLYDKVS